MWKCTRCEKENQDTEEICTECGHGRTMDYISHRTLSKVANALSRNWKKANRKEAEKFVQEKITGLSHSVKEEKKKIADNQNEITTLNGTVQKQNKIIEKDKKTKKAIKVVVDISMILASIGGILFWISCIYETSKGNADSIDIEYIKQDIISFIVCAVMYALLAYGIVTVIFYILGSIASGLIQLIMGKSADEETLKNLTKERDNAQQSITEKTNEITAVQSEINTLEQQIQRIKKDKESIINKLSQLSPQEMEKEFARLV